MGLSSNGVAGLKAGVVDSTATRPAAPYEGQMIFQKDTDQLLVWNGSAWVIPNQTTTNPEGLELVKTQTISGSVGSVTVTNAFSSTYDNYYITYSGGYLSNAAAIGLQLGPSSVTGYNTGYYGGVSRVTVLAASANLGMNNNSSWNYISVGDLSGCTMSFKIFEPFLAKPTRMFTEWSDPRTTDAWGAGGGSHQTASSYTDFLISGGANLVGGTINVYGYRK
jgi:hypothetical protein